MITHFKIKCPVCKKLPNLVHLPQDNFFPLITLGQTTNQNIDCQCGTTYVISLNGTVFLFNHGYSYYQNVVSNEVTLFQYIPHSDTIIEPQSLDGTLLIFNKKVVDQRIVKREKQREEEKIARENALFEGIKALGEVEKARHEERVKELERIKEALNKKELEINSKLFDLMNKMLDKT